MKRETLCPGSATLRHETDEERVQRAPRFKEESDVEKPYDKKDKNSKIDR